MTPSVSVLFLSCKRLRYLTRTLDAIRCHFQMTEPHVSARYICFDNGSSEEDRAALDRMGFDELILSRENLGIGPAMNRLLATVRTPYFLNLQDDWELRNDKKIHFFSQCRKILESDEKLASIKLDTCHFLKFDDRSIYDGPFQINNDSPPFYVQNPKMLWGGFTFPPALTRTSAIHTCGPFVEDQPLRRGWAESEYSARYSQNFLSAKSPEMLLFHHIGDEASTGWADAKRQVTPEVTTPGKGHQPSLRRDGKITCLLTAYRRPQNLRRQFEAINAQSVKPEEIVLWHNHHPESIIDETMLKSVKHITSQNTNWGVWPRFLLCNEFDTEYVCVFDDDTIPGRLWLENCLEVMRRSEGLLGTIGVIFPNGDRQTQIKVGWPNPVNKIVEVDIVGHAWFFKRDWLRQFAVEPRQGGATFGEDYHFSVAIQKHLGLSTFVPPHDPSNKETWGSIEGDLGKDQVALYLKTGESEKKEAAHNGYLKAGWRPLAQRKGINVAPSEVDLNCPNKPPFGPVQNRDLALISPIRFEQDFERDFEKIDLYGKPFALARFGDGECAICTGRKIRVSDGWSFDGSNVSMANDLREALIADIPGYYLGISCPCCDPAGAQWYRRTVRAPKERLTFANIFVNANYKRFKALNLSNTVLVSSERGDFKVPRDAITEGFDYSELLTRLFSVDRTILVAAGPLSCILIHKYWLYAPRPQVIIDIGSTLDPLIYGKPTRSYHHVDSPNTSKVCVW